MTEDEMAEEIDFAREDERAKAIKAMTWVFAVILVMGFTLAGWLSVFHGLILTSSGAVGFFASVLLHWICRRTKLTDYLEPLWLGSMYAGLMVLALAALKAVLAI